MDYLQKIPNYSHECYAQKPSRYSQRSKLFTGVLTPKRSTDAIFIRVEENKRVTNIENNQERRATSLRKMLLGRSQDPGKRPSGTRALSEKVIGQVGKLWLLTWHRLGLRAGNSELHTQTHHLPLTLGYKGKDECSRQGGEAASSGERRSYLPVGDGPRERGNDATHGREPGKKGAGGATPGLSSGLSGMAFPAPQQPRLFQVKVYLGGWGGEKEREEGSRLLTWAPRFC